MLKESSEFENINYEYDLSFYSIIHFVKYNIVQILMLLLVVIIIYIVDHISQINAAIYGLPSAISGLPSNHVINKETKVPFRKQRKSHRK